jgi:hypothetical protein
MGTVPSNPGENSMLYVAQGFMKFGCPSEWNKPTDKKETFEAFCLPAYNAVQSVSEDHVASIFTQNRQARNQRENIWQTLTGVKTLSVHIL